MQDGVVAFAREHMMNAVEVPDRLIDSLDKLAMPTIAKLVDRLKADTKSRASSSSGYVRASSEGLLMPHIARTRGSSQPPCHIFSNLLMHQ